MKIFQGIFSILKNKYLLALIFFIAWMLFFDPKDWFTIYARMQKAEELDKSQQQLAVLISDTQKELALLKTNTHTIVQYAREKYHMKKDNEDVFIVKTP